MARKDLLKGLMNPQTEPSDKPSRVDAARPRYTTGAIGAVSASIADLKSRSVTEIDPLMIDDAGISDRLASDPDDHKALMASIKTYGQQVPVLVRPNPNDPERYQVVYGRRRVAALRDLGLPVRALVRVLGDRELIIAQGQENSARKDLTFIEKANFARQMRDSGYERKVICDALHMDKTLISRMLSVADTVPIALIEAIGAAPSVGRDRWLSLADKLDGRDMTKDAKGETSDIRFDAVMRSLATPKPPAPRPTRVQTAAGDVIGTVQKKGGNTVVTLQAKQADGFDDWLIANLAEIHRDWSKTRD